MILHQTRALVRAHDQGIVVTTHCQEGAFEAPNRIRDSPTMKCKCERRGAVAAYQAVPRKRRYARRHGMSLSLANAALVAIKELSKDGLCRV